MDPLPPRHAEPGSRSNPVETPAADAARIILTTFNARYIHSSLGLRYLYANLGELQDSARIEELTLALPVEEAVERLLALKPEIIGFGVYIWNAVRTSEAVRLIRSIAPEVTLVVGGPEVSFEIEEQALCRDADYVVTGQADFSFAGLCRDVLNGEPPANRVVSSLPLEPATLKSPYPFYSEHDLKNRLVYVEASRGCPFKCEFCLSSLDKTATPFPLPEFLAQMESLVERGARHFKFVDRTFNLKVDSCLAILDFFLQYLPGGSRSDEIGDTPLFLHFELIPDRLPERLKDRLTDFPEGVLQFEIGIQSFNPEVQKLVSRRQDMTKTISNMTWLRENTHAHIHSDLIFGLPGESLESFADGFNQLYLLRPQEIQLGILKRLRGTPIERHTREFGMVYQPDPPYRILKNDLLDFETVQRVSRVARYWDLIANSGRFKRSLPVLLGELPFQNFLALSDWLYLETRQTHGIALARLFRLVERGATEINRESGNFTPNRLQTLKDLLEADFADAGFNGQLVSGTAASKSRTQPQNHTQNHRQQRHRVE